MPVFNLSIDPKLYRKIDNVRVYLQHKKIQSITRIILDSFPYELIKEMDKVILETNHKNYQELIEKAVLKYLDEKEK